MLRLGLYFLGATTALIAVTQVTDSTAIGLWSGLATGLAVPIIDATVSNSRYWRLALWSIRLYRSRIRISISYLYRIELDGRYLLIRGHRYPSQFQPVGGVYKFNESARDKFARWSVQTDDLIPIDSVSSDDLRIRVPGKNLIKLVRWFESGENREYGPWREFYEELIRTNLVSIEDFWNIRSEYVRTHYNPIRFSPFADSYELLICDVIRLIPNPQQKAMLISLASSTPIDNTKVALFSDSQIRRHGAEPGIQSTYTIPPTAEWTL